MHRMFEGHPFPICNQQTPLKITAVKLICSECSPTVQQLQSNPPPESEVEVGLQWVQFNFAVTAVWSPLWLPCPPNNQKLKLGCSECSSTLQWLQSDPPWKTSRTHVVACHLLVKVLWATGFTHFTSWSGKSHKATNSSWDKSKHFYLDNSESG